ncbi:MAG: SPFH domain-containing protein [Desulfobaccales bacterium]
MLILILVLAGLVALFLIIVAACYTKVGPNEVLIISGRKRKLGDTQGRRTVGYRIVRGGGTVVWPILEQVRTLSLELMNLEVKTPEVYTSHGVPVAVDGVVQLKIKGDDTSIAIAAEQFLSKTSGDIMKTALQVTEGHMRAVLGTLSIEEIYTRRNEFAQKVKEMVAPDLAKMGLEVVSLTIKDITDPRGYLEALGRPRIAQVKRDAIIGEASADEEAKIFRYSADTKIEEARRDFEIQKAEYEAAMAQRRAESDLSYDLQRFKSAQEVKQQEVQLGILEKQLHIELEEKEVARKEKELAATVLKPAEAERRRVEVLAEAERFRRETEAHGEAEAIQATGLAEANIIKEKGVAEARAMKEKAASWSEYNEAAVTEMFINILPKLAQAVSEPLSRTEKIVIISGSDGGTGAHRVTQDVSQILAQLPPVIEALTGVKLEKLLERIPALTGKEKEEKKIPSA